MNNDYEMDMDAVAFRWGGRGEGRHLLPPPRMQGLHEAKCVFDTDVISLGKSSARQDQSGLSKHFIDN